MFEPPPPASTLSAFSDLSGPAEAVLRATESGCGVLSLGRPWVQHEGWVLKEAGLAGGWHLRFFVVSGDRLEYFKEERVKLELAGATVSDALAAVGVALDHTNVVSAAPSGKTGGLQEGDIVIGVGGEEVLSQPLASVLAQSLAGSSSAPVGLTVLRPRGRVSLLGASVNVGGPRKQGGHVLTINVSDTVSRRSRYNLVVAEERLCAGWVASIKEAIAAAAMEEIKTGLSQALQLQALQHDQQPSDAPLLPDGPALQRSASLTDTTILSEALARARPASKETQI
jgi:hypothetical protein